MPACSRVDALKKYLFGGALFAAGFAAQQAHAQEFSFIDTSTFVFATAGGDGDRDSFAGAGPWSIVASAFDPSEGSATATSVGTPTGVKVTLFCLNGGWGVATAESLFVVTSDCTIEAAWGGTGWVGSSFTLTDLTHGVVLLSAGQEPVGTALIRLDADFQYELSFDVVKRSGSSLTNGQAWVTIVPAPSSVALLGIGALFSARRRRA